MNERDESFEELPAGLREGLRGVFEPGRGMGAGRDAAILRAARGAYLRRRARRWKWAAGMGIAAAVALTAGLWWVQVGKRSGPMTPSVADEQRMPMRSGDIRDAYYVAREIKAGKRLSLAWDANGDGQVDAADVQVLALAAVKIGKEGTQ